MKSLPIFMLAAILVWCIAEGYGLGTPQKGDTFSEIWWLLRDERVTRFFIWGLFTWASYHLMMQRVGVKRPQGWRDLVAISAGFVAAAVETYITHRGTR